MKNILFLHHGLGLGGAERMRSILLRNIDKKRYNIKVCCVGEKGVLGREIEKLGYQVDELKQDSNSISLLITYKLVKYIRRERPDILHTSLFNSNFHGRIAGLFCRIPHIITEEHGEHKQYKGLKFLPYVLADFFLSRLNDFIICCSEKLKEDIIKKERLPRSKTISLENCLDVDIYRIKAHKREIRERHNISDELLFIMVANLKADKGHDYLIEIFREIRDAGYRFKCFFAGEGPLRKALRKKCADLGLSDEIIFLGNVDNITDYLNASDVFVLPSFSEGLSIALMEAMLMGLASIVTDVGSNPDLIKTDFNGVVVLPGDREGLKNAIIFYFKNKGLIEEFGKRSKSIIKSKYSSVDKYTNKYYELWDKCVNNKG